MSKSICESDSGAWRRARLKDWHRYAESVEYVNQREYGDGQLEGEWYYCDIERGVIYWGTFGNYNAPGAIHYTHAEVYDLRDVDEYDKMLSDLDEWRAKPEYANQE